MLSVRIEGLLFGFIVAREAVYICIEDCHCITHVPFGLYDLSHYNLSISSG